MKTGLLYGEVDKGRLFQIITVGGRNLQGRAVFADNGFSCIAFKVGKYETVPIKSVRKADQIYDYYFSAQTASETGYCTADRDMYTEAIPAGDEPLSKWDDLQYIKTAAGCDIRSFAKRVGFTMLD